jgi:hypothetical protein
MTGHALTAFPEIQKDVDTFQAITKNYRLNTITEFSDIDKLMVYREYKKLSAIHLDQIEILFWRSILCRNVLTNSRLLRGAAGGISRCSEPGATL